MNNALPPTAYTVFSQAPKPTRSETLEIVNRFVNHGIDAKQGEPRLNDPWRIGPQAGWCHDYAVTKQWLLAALGIASELCECIAPDGEHHMVLLVDGVALDNLASAIGPMRYQVVRTQSNDNPDFWESV
jgi:predicted transglutaminase-like cysteine proteinase